jgi:hypothetical protein
MPSLIAGLDLGQTADPSALVIIEQSTFPDPDPDRKGCTLNQFDIRHIHRWDLGTKYTKVVSDLQQMYAATAKLVDTPLIVDETGVGRAVVEMVETCGIRADIRAYTITAGFREGEFQSGHGTVPKLQLAGAVQAAIQQRRVRYADGLQLGPVLEREMESFHVKVTPDRNETFAHWRESDKDDLVLATALAIWWGEKNSDGGSWAQAVLNSPPPPPIYPDYFPKHGTGW